MVGDEVLKGAAISIKQGASGELIGMIDVHPL